MPVNPKITSYAFLDELYRDPYYPHPVLDKGKAILLRVCDRIEADRPADLTALYAITHAATEEFNLLQDDFDQAGSELETVARDAIGTDFHYLAQAYGFADADIEELIATRDW